MILSSHIPAVNCSFPENALSVSNLLIEVFAFDLMRSDLLNEYIFEFSPALQEPFSPNFEFIGLESRSAIAILGPEFYFIAGALILYPFI